MTNAILSDIRLSPTCKRKKKKKKKKKKKGPCWSFATLIDDREDYYDYDDLQGSKIIKAPMDYIADNVGDSEKRSGSCFIGELKSPATASCPAVRHPQDETDIMHAAKLVSVHRARPVGRIRDSDKRTVVGGADRSG